MRRCIEGPILSEGGMDFINLHNALKKRFKRVIQKFREGEKKEKTIGNLASCVSTKGRNPRPGLERRTGGKRSSEREKLWTRSAPYK